MIETNEKYPCYGMPTKYEIFQVSSLMQAIVSRYYPKMDGRTRYIIEGENSKYSYLGSDEFEANFDNLIQINKLHLYFNISLISFVAIHITHTKHKELTLNIKCEDGRLPDAIQAELKENKSLRKLLRLDFGLNDSIARRRLDDLIASSYANQTDFNLEEELLLNQPDPTEYAETEEGEAPPAAEIPGTSQVQPAQRKKGKKGLVIAGGTVVVLVALALAYYYFLS